jgi:hypothetical protein
MVFVALDHFAICLHARDARAAVLSSRGNAEGIAGVAVNPSRLQPSAWIRFVWRDEMKALRVYTVGITMAKKSAVHVVKQSGGTQWNVKQGGETISTHRTQGNAIDRGRQEARKDGVDLVTHGRGGQIRSKDSFGRDPNPPKDREH